VQTNVNIMMFMDAINSSPVNNPQDRNEN
jgi:hypothetical protein